MHLLRTVCVLVLLGTALLKCSESSDTASTPNTTAPTTRQAEALAVTVMETNVQWTIRCAPQGGEFLTNGICVADGVYLTAPEEHPNALDSSPPLAEISDALLRALDNPKTALNAHIALCVRYGTDKITIPHESIKIGEVYTANLDGLDVHLRPTKWFRPKSYWIMFRASAEVDPKKLPAIREQWHRRLIEKQKAK